MLNNLCIFHQSWLLYPSFIFLFLCQHRALCFSSSPPLSNCNNKPDQRRQQREDTKAAAAGRLSRPVFNPVFGVCEQICRCTRLNNRRYIVQHSIGTKCGENVGAAQPPPLCWWADSVLLLIVMCCLSIDHGADSVADRQADTRLHGCN